MFITNSHKLRTLLQEAAAHYNTAKEKLPPHDWSLWYATYIEQRDNGPVYFTGLHEQAARIADAAVRSALL